MRYVFLVTLIFVSPAVGQTWQQTDCSIVERFAREAASDERNPSAAYVLALEAMLNEAIARLPGEDLDAVLDLGAEMEESRDGWPNQTTELMESLLKDRCGVVFR